MAHRSKALASVCLGLLLVPLSPGQAADRQWVEARTPHFIVATDSTERTARSILWQFEQVRVVIRTLCPWASADIPKPVLVLTCCSAACRSRADEPTFRIVE